MPEEKPQHITLIDLNNFAYYPTLAIGLLARYIRDAGYDLTVLSPLSQGIKSRKREKTERSIDYLITRIVLSDRWIVRKLLQHIKKIAFVKERYMGKQRIYRFVKSSMPNTTDLVLISTYTENHSIFKKVSSLLYRKGIPIMIGGPGFNEKSSISKFLKLPGVTCIVGTEVDDYIGDMLDDYFAQGAFAAYPGVYEEEPLEDPDKYVFKKMNSLPLPDYSDFPWEKYPHKVIPYMTARGCSWAKCNFCTDVHYVNGRSFRSVNSEKIIDDLSVLSKSIGTNVVNFLDIKLNSDVRVWNDLIDRLPKIIAQPIWFCSVHVDNRENNGLDINTLKSAHAAGLTRISFGLETGSQRLLNDMKKGTTVEKLERFVQDVYSVGISLRATMFLNYPDENANDLKATLEFLKRNHHCFDRIRIGKFKAFPMAPIYDLLKNDKNIKLDSSDIVQNKTRLYRIYKTKILKLIHHINKRGLNESARVYDGVM